MSSVDDAGGYSPLSCFDSDEIGMLEHDVNAVPIDDNRCVLQLIVASEMVGAMMRKLSKAVS